jgi:hypothetical protein
MAGMGFSWRGNLGGVEVDEVDSTVSLNKDIGGVQVSDDHACGVQLCDRSGQIFRRSAQNVRAGLREVHATQGWIVEGMQLLGTGYEGKDETHSLRFAVHRPYVDGHCSAFHWPAPCNHVPPFLKICPLFKDLDCPIRMTFHGINRGLGASSQSL